jgi:YgiT-type zinc finger domain-containing protein
MYCRGNQKRATAPFYVERQGYHIHWSDVPAWVCTQCGEPLFESREVDAIQRALKILDAETGALLGRG